MERVENLTAWRRDGRRFAVATVVSVSGSAPHPSGAALAVDGTGRSWAACRAGPNCAP
ncbi:XdhC family protein [Saccharothrix luteola]|uniref:XdhC family protein n=1 Tax=Saccharothrix luteola TaxID=2893018 RepID=UPI003556B5AB